MLQITLSSSRAFISPSHHACHCSISSGSVSCSPCIKSLFFSRFFVCHCLCSRKAAFTRPLKASCSRSVFPHTIRYHVTLSSGARLRISSSTVPETRVHVFNPHRPWLALVCISALPSTDCLLSFALHSSPTPLPPDHSPTPSP